MTNVRESLTIRLEKQLLPPKLPAQIASWLVPVISTITILALLWLLGGKDKVGGLITYSIVSFFGGGKLIVFVPCLPLEKLPEAFKILKDIQGMYNIWELAGMVVYMDSMTAIVVTYNLHILNKIPKIGPMLKNTRKDCYFLLQANPWMHKMAFIAVILFVAFPISGTGAIAGAFLATLLGLSRVTAIITIFIGGFLGSYGMGLAAWKIGADAKMFIENPLIAWGSLIGLVVLIILGSMKMKKMIAEQKAKELAEQNSPHPTIDVPPSPQV